MTGAPNTSDEAHGATILVVDDEPHNREVIATFLGMEGFHVLQAEDGEHALELVSAHAPDVILLDVIMPGPDGFEVCRRLKAQPETLFTPVVILTALRGTQERIRGASAGADDFLSKPFDNVELVTRVRSLVRIKRYHDQIQAHAQALENRVAERTAELQRALSDLQELDRLKSEFIANVSHELRTPLLHVKGYVSLLADGMLGEMTPEQSQGLNIAQEAIEQLGRVVEDIVDFSEVHERELTFEAVSVPDVCRNVLQLLLSQAERRSIDVKLNLPGDLPPVLADRAALTRILRHLLDNAIKFGPRGNTVEMVAEPQRAFVRLAVRDHGPGILAEQLPNIFQAFFQADGSSTRPAGGLGLGLALVKSLVEAHGSQIHVESVEGEGSLFYFELPRAI